MDFRLGHEKLDVYQRALGFVLWKESLLVEITGEAAVLGHLDRASEGIVECIANGNSRRSPKDRNRFFDIALGSALECAASLDICRCKQLISVDTQEEGKAALLHIVRMTIGLRAEENLQVREANRSYEIGGQAANRTVFPHEALGAYQAGLDLIRWLDDLVRLRTVSQKHVVLLDKTTTSLVLNIAEGNGRFSKADHKRFLDIAHTCAMRTASRLDLLVTKGCLNSEGIKEGKMILARLVPSLLGLRNYLVSSTDG